MKFMLKCRLFAAGAICAGIVGVVPAVASAHTLVENKGISAVMHIDPTDQPVANVPVNVTFAFEQTRPGFSMTRCDCLVEVRHGNQDSTLTRAVPAAAKAKRTLASMVTFPEQGSYVVSLYGLVSPGSNDTFRLAYTVNVAPERHGVSQGVALMIDIAAFMIAIIVAAGLAAYFRNTRMAADHLSQPRR